MKNLPQFGVPHLGGIFARMDVDGRARVDGMDFNSKVRGQTTLGVD